MDPQNLPEIIAIEPALLVYFYNDHCAPCLALRPKVLKLIEEEFPKIKFILVNTKADPALAASFSVYSSPAILVYFEGKEQARFSKYVSINQIRELLTRSYGLVIKKA